MRTNDDTILRNLRHVDDVRHDTLPAIHKRWIVHCEVAHEIIVLVLSIKNFHQHRRGNVNHVEKCKTTMTISLSVRSTYLLFDKVRNERCHVVEHERVRVEPDDDGEVRRLADELQQVELELCRIPRTIEVTVRRRQTRHDATQMLGRQRREHAVARLSVVRQKAGGDVRRMEEKRAQRDSRHCRELLAAVGEEAHDRRAQMLQY